MTIVRFQGETPNIYYEFDRDSMPLGEGGMGRIYQGFRIDVAHQFQSIVAIKCIRQELAANPAVIQRAQREGTVILDHENLIRMYGFFSGAEYNQFSASYVPAYYLVMERLVGVNLDDVLFKGVTIDKSGMPVPIAEEILEGYRTERERTSVNLMLSILSGVDFMHKSGFVHRDLDPSNVMLTQEGNIKVIDFGISKRNGGVYGSGLTQAGQFLGKVSFASPELILGDLNSQGPCTDIYALGIILFQFLTGYLPVNGTDQEVMDAHLKGSLDFSCITNKSLRKIIEKATAKDIRKRYSSAMDMITDLHAVTFNVEKKAEWVDPKPKKNKEKTVKVRKEYTPITLPSFLIPASAAAGLFLGIVCAIVF